MAKPIDIEFEVGDIILDKGPRKLYLVVERIVANRPHNHFNYYTLKNLETGELEGKREKDVHTNAWKLMA
jgi:hypothetical protein